LFKFEPGLFKPWTFDPRMVAVDYALWGISLGDPDLE
jgi:hypothetical protein